MNQNQKQMSEEYILSKLSDFNLDVANVDGFEIAQFLDLAKDIKRDDYDKGVDFVLTRRNLEGVDSFGKFKYFCGYLQKIKRVYKLQNQYQNGELHKNRE